MRISTRTARSASKRRQLAGSTDLVNAPVALAQIVVTGVSASLGAVAGTIKFTSNSGDITEAQTFAVRGGFTAVAKHRAPVFGVPRGEKMTITSSGFVVVGYIS